VGRGQRALIDLQMTIGSSTTPSPPSPVNNKLELRHAGILRKRDNLLKGEGGGRGQIIRRRESLVLYKSFNTIWLSREDGGKVPRYFCRSIIYRDTHFSYSHIRIYFILTLLSTEYEYCRIYFLTFIYTGVGFSVTIYQL